MSQNSFAIISLEGTIFNVNPAKLADTTSYFNILMWGHEAKTLQMQTGTPAKYLRIILNYCDKGELPEPFEDPFDNIQLIGYLDMYLLTLAKELFEYDVIAKINANNVIDYLNASAPLLCANAVNEKCQEIIMEHR